MTKEMQAMHTGGGAGSMNMMGAPCCTAPMAGMDGGEAMPAGMTATALATDRSNVNEQASSLKA